MKVEESVEKVDVIKPPSPSPGLSSCPLSSVPGACAGTRSLSVSHAIFVPNSPSAARWIGSVDSLLASRAHKRDKHLLPFAHLLIRVVGN